MIGSSRPWCQANAPLDVAAAKLLLSTTAKDGSEEQLEMVAHQWLPGRSWHLGVG
jgi:hypothetical protein